MFNISDDFAFIPLITSALAVLVLLIFLLRAAKRNAGKNTLTQFFALVILLAGIVLTIFFPSILILAACITVSLLILLPHLLYLEKQSAVEEENDFEFAPSEEEQTLESSLAEESAKREEEDAVLLEVSRDFLIHGAESFSEESGLPRLLDFINTSIIREIKADGGAILLVDDFDDVITVKSFSGSFPPPYQLPSDIPHKIVRVETNFRFASFPLNENIFGEVARTGRPEFITNPLSDSRLYQNEPEDFLKLGSYIFVPLKIKGSVIGIAAFARKNDSSPFTEKDYKSALILSGFAGAAIKSVFSFQEIVEHSELTREAEIACKIQTKMHPKLLPSIPSLSLGHYFNTAEGVCGDFYDIIPSRKDRISIVLADVAGKGMNSLLIMVMLRAILRLVVNTTQTAATILSWANRGISVESSIDHFASLALINYDSVAQKIQYSTAGTTPVYLYKASTKKVERLSAPSEPIGVEKTSVYVDNETDVNSGDIVITFTDGIVESINAGGNQYTTQRLTTIIEQNSSLSGKEIAAIVKEDIKKFIGSARQHDDQTLLVIKII